MNRLVVVVVAAIVVVLPAVALADPAGPTDYRTEIVGVDPPVPDLGLAMLGGDSFLELTAPPGVEVAVVGYEGEPYLRFDPDGTVHQNLRSPSTYLNEDRFAETELPPEADAAAEPEWVQVADDGRYAWHDHRTHWMNPQPPPGAEPGDTILEAVVPLRIDGEAVLVTVRSEFVAPPGPWASSLGAVVGLVLAAGAVRAGSTAPRVALVVLATAALGVGLWERFSMPTEAAASPLVFLLPAGALLFALAARPGSPVAGIAAAASAVQLVGWSIVRWGVMVEPILPTDAPWALDRFVTGMVLAGGAWLLATSVRSVVRGPAGAAEAS